MTAPKSNYVWAALSGFFMTAAFPKIDLSWCAWFALVPLLIAIRDATPRQGFLLAMMAGMVHYIGLLYWLVHTMHIYGYLPIYQSVAVLIIMATVLSIFWGCFGWFATTKIDTSNQISDLNHPNLFILAMAEKFPWKTGKKIGAYIFQCGPDCRQKPKLIEVIED